MIAILRAAGAALLDVVKAQLAILTTGWAAELERAVRLLYWIGVSLIFLLFAGTLLSIALVMALWEQRIWVAAALAVIAFGLWAWSFWRWQSLLHRAPRRPPPIF